MRHTIFFDGHNRVIFLSQTMKSPRNVRPCDVCFHHAEIGRAFGEGVENRGENQRIGTSKPGQLPTQYDVRLPAGDAINSLQPFYILGSSGKRVGEKAYFFAMTHRYI